MVQYQIENDLISLKVPGNHTLPELSQLFDFSFCWWLGRGVYKFTVVRFKDPEGNLEALIVPKSRPKVLAVSPVTDLATLVKEKYFPTELHAVEALIMNQHVKVRDGQNRISATTARDGTIMQHHDLRPQLTIAEMAFGLSDAVVGSFCLGAKKFEWCGSMTLTQAWHDVGLNQNQLERYVKQRYEYAATRTVDMMTGW